jgi:hypothetical protein
LLRKEWTGRGWQGVHEIVHLKALDNNRYIRMDIALLEMRKNIVRSGEGKLPKNT